MLLRNSEHLEWLQIAWAGAENFVDPVRLNEKTVLTNASGAYGISVAEHMLSLTLALSCSLNKYIRQQMGHVWQLCDGKENIYGKKVLILGTGDIGCQYAIRIKAMGAYVTGISRTKKNKMSCMDEQYTINELNEVIGEADIVAMALPGVRETYHIVSEDQIGHMKQNALIINAGRGSTIDTESLIKALSSGRIRGAGLDVFEEEPLPDYCALWDMENVIITPHAAGKLEDKYNMERVISLCTDNLYRYTHNRKLLHVVDREWGY